jgi:hypothetical protein
MPRRWSARCSDSWSAEGTGAKRGFADGSSRSAVKQRRTLPDARHASTTLRTPLLWVHGGWGTSRY